MALMARELIGRVGVDSGQLMVIDPCYVGYLRPGGFDDPGSSYRQICDLTLRDLAHGVVPFENAHPSVTAVQGGMAAVFASGYGDGLYPVYAVKNAEGRVVRVEIVMDDEEDG